MTRETRVGQTLFLFFLFIPRRPIPSSYLAQRSLCHRSIILCRDLPCETLDVLCRQACFALPPLAPLTRFRSPGLVAAAADLPSCRSHHRHVGQALVKYARH